MIEPYQAVGLIQTMRGIRRREEISWNLEHISHMVKAASWLSSMDLPVRLICIPEGGLQGFTDEVLDLAEVALKAAAGAARRLDHDVKDRGMHHGGLW